MGSSIFWASLWWTASTMCFVFSRSFVAACTVKTSSAISPLASAAVDPISQMVSFFLPLRVEVINKMHRFCTHPVFLWLSIWVLAETSMTEDYHGDQSEAKRYSVDHGDSAFGSISSSYSSKSSYGFRSSQQFSSSSGAMTMCRQPTSSPNMFPDGNRTG